MTHDEILNMEAGREMDALVAEKVMGWREYDYKFYSSWEIAEGVFRRMSEFQPSIDIASAWEVVEKIRTTIIHGLPVCPNIVYHHSIPAWHCELFNNMWMRQADADTAPLAICRAALLATSKLEEQ